MSLFSANNITNCESGNFKMSTNKICLEIYGLLQSKEFHIALACAEVESRTAKKSL